MPKNTPAAEPETALAPTEQRSPLALVREVLETIPQADEDPTERMAAFILSQPAERWDELWAGLPNLKDNAGQVVTIHAIRARESDFEGPLGLYLIADVTWDKTGEKGLLSASSQMVIVQLLTLYRRGQFPAKVEIVAKDKPTKAGFRPIHLRYLGAPQVALGDPGAVVAEQ